MLIMFGGLDTTASAIGHALYYLGRNPDRREWLRQNPDQIPVAIEEFLRIESPVQGLRRTETCETELNGQHLCPGENVWVLWASANRDPSEFDHPDEMDLERSPNRHVAFGVGKHRCLGSNLARAMMRISLEEVLERVPDYSIGPDSELSRFADSSVVYGLTGLPDQLTQCPRRPGWAQQR
jgi:cytochrome P450